MIVLSSLIHKLEEKKNITSDKIFLTGFDGFIDQVTNVVETREDMGKFEPVASMKRFGQLIGEASNRSSLREIVIDSVEIGGCAVNMGDGLTALGGKLDFYGTAGNPSNSAFDKFASNCRRFVPLPCDPGLTIAFEFDDGKYMLSSVSQLAELSRELLEKEIREGSFVQSCGEADLIALTNWTLYPHMTDCWSSIQEMALGKLENRPSIFIDLVDPRSRSDKDIEEMLGVLKNFETFGDTIFGGNLNEGNVLARLLNLNSAVMEGEDVARLAREIRMSLGISAVLIHCVGGAASSDGEGSYWENGPYCPVPLKSTGAGDRFNAGFAMGMVLDLEPRERLVFAGAVSGFFVRHGFSGSMDQIIELISKWDKGEL